MGIKTFSYIKIFENGSYLALSTHEDFLRQYFFIIETQGNVFTIDIETLLIGQPHHVLYPSSISLFDENKDALAHLAYGHNVWHPYAIYKNNSAFIELYSFAMNKDNEYAPQFYLANIPLLEHFCMYLNEMASDLICEKS